MNNTLLNSSTRLRIGIFGVALEAYWSQFDGLEQKLNGYLDQVVSQLERPSIEIVNLGLVDTPERAMSAGHQFRREDVDLIFLYATTYALSSTILPVVQRARVPVIVLNLAPKAAIDYSTFNRMNDRTMMTGEWLSYCSACTIPEIASVFKRSGIPLHQVTGMLENDPECWEEIRAWLDAAEVAHVMSHNRLGVMGHYYGGMLDIYADLTQQCAHFGGHIEILEVDQLTTLRAKVTSNQIDKKVAEFIDKFSIDQDCSNNDLREAARTSVALDQLVESHNLGSMAYYYKGESSRNGDSIASIILGNSLLTARGIPVAGEYEVKNAQAMKIMDAFGAGGSFTEFYALDFNDDVVLMGHDGPAHIAIAEGKARVRPLEVYHGKVGRGLSIQMSVKHGPVTLLSVVQGIDGRLSFLVAEAESVPGPILEIGNTNSRYRFKSGVRTFVNAWNAQGPAHHCAVGIGHIGHKIQKLGLLLDIETILLL